MYTVYMERRPRTRMSLEETIIDSCSRSILLSVSPSTYNRFLFNARDNPGRYIFKETSIGIKFQNTSIQQILYLIRTEYFTSFSTLRTPDLFASILQFEISEYENIKASVFRNLQFSKCNRDENIVEIQNL